MKALTLFEIVAAILALFVGVRWQKSRKNPKGLPLPPGPPGRFLVGNLRDLPQSGYEWIEHAKPVRKYGDIVYFNILGKSMLFINSYQAANDLLDKKGGVYSDRPRMPLAKELKGWDWNLALMSYSQGFATHRRIVQQKLQQQVVATSYRPIMLCETRILLQSKLAKPDQFVAHLKK